MKCTTGRLFGHATAGNWVLVDVFVVSVKELWCMNFLCFRLQTGTFIGESFFVWLKNDWEKLLKLLLAFKRGPSSIRKCSVDILCNFRLSFSGNQAVEMITSSASSTPARFLLVKSWKIYSKT